MLQKAIATIIGIFSLTGLYSSFLLTVEKIEIIKNPAPLVCDINSVISCSTVMKSDQAEVLGFPNSLIGVLGYGMTLSFALSLFFAKDHKKLLLIGFTAGAFGAFAFSYWLIYQSIFVIGALCPFCLLSAASATNIFFALLILNLSQSKNEKLKKFISKHYYILPIVLWYTLAIGGIILEYNSLING